MAKIVYGDNREILRIPKCWWTGKRWNYTSAFKDGRIIADDNIFEGL